MLCFAGRTKQKRKSRDKKAKSLMHLHSRPRVSQRLPPSSQLPSIPPARVGSAALFPARAFAGPALGVPTKRVLLRSLGSFARLALSLPGVAHCAALGLAGLGWAGAGLGLGRLGDTHNTLRDMLSLHFCVSLTMARVLLASVFALQGASVYPPPVGALCPPMSMPCCGLLLCHVGAVTGGFLLR